MNEWKNYILRSHVHATRADQLYFFCMKNLPTLQREQRSTLKDDEYSQFGMNLDLWPFQKPTFCWKRSQFLKQTPKNWKWLWFRGRKDKRKELPACEADHGTTNCFLSYFGSLRDVPTTFLDAGTRELILLMSPAAERILYPPELKVTPGTTHGSIAVRLAPELHFPSRGLDPCNNPIKAPSDNKWAPAELDSRVHM